MEYKKKVIAMLSVMLCVVAILFGCSPMQGDKESSLSQSSINNSTDDSKSTSLNNEKSDDDMFTDRDMCVTYDENKALDITLEDNASKCSEKSVEILKNTITIKDEGIYVISGTLSNGQIVVDTDKSNKVQLVLNGANINCNTSAAIYVKQADKVFVTLAEKSNNTLSNKEEFAVIDENNVDAVIFAKDDLTLNGNGSLNIASKYGHAVVSKNDLKITSGVYNINSASHGLSGKDSVRIANGDITITSGKDGIHSENKDDTSKGFVYIANCKLNITCDGDGIDSSAHIKIKDGSYIIKSGGGRENAEEKQEEFFRNFGDQKDENSIDNSVSSKGIKSISELTISGGELSIDSSDDSIHSNSNVKITNGILNFSTGDDGIHADGNVSVSGGTLKILNSYEGIEGQSIDILNGDITVKSSDDGLNAAGGTDNSGTQGGMRDDPFSVDENSYIKISGGELKIDADGDGIDSNGNLEVTGGTIYVSGPSSSNNGALDYNGTATITGGTIIAVGASGMAQNFGSNSTQCSILCEFPKQITGEVVLKDKTGNVIVNYSPSKSYNSVLISCADIKTGETYTVSAGDQTTIVEMTNIIYGEGHSMGDMKGGIHGPGGMGNHSAMPNNKPDNIPNDIPANTPDNFNDRNR